MPLVPLLLGAEDACVLAVDCACCAACVYAAELVVALTGGITRRETAEKALANGVAMIGMATALGVLGMAAAAFTFPSVSPTLAVMIRPQ